LVRKTIAGAKIVKSAVFQSLATAPRTRIEFFVPCYGPDAVCLVEHRFCFFSFHAADRPQANGKRAISTSVAPFFNTKDVDLKKNSRRDSSDCLL